MRGWLPRLPLLAVGLLIAPACGKISGTPGPFTLTLPANLDAAVPVTGVSFEWTASPTAVSYRFELADSAAFDSILMAEDNLTTTVFSPAFGLTHSTSYYWRVRARSALGTILAANAPFVFTTVAAGPGPPGPFTLSAPADGATGVSTTPTFSWTASANAISYTLEIATDAAFTAIVGSQSGILFTFASSPVTLSTNTLYFWRVASANGAGTTPAGGAPFSFTTSAAAPLPGSFTLSSPPDGATGFSRMPTFTWTSSANVVSYTLEIATDGSFTAIVGSQAGITATSAASPITLNASTPYFWRVTAVNGAGSTPATGAPFSFTTTAAALPASVNLMNPLNGETGVAIVPTFRWLSSGAVSHTLEIASDAAFTTVVGTSANLGGTVTPSPVALSTSTTYYWRVLAVNGAGTTVSSPAARPFTTTAPWPAPGAFTLNAPADGASGVSRAPAFSWTASAGVDTYALEIATDAGFSAIVATKMGVPGTSTVSPILLGANSTFYWRVTAFSPGSSTPATGAPFSFTTGSGHLDLAFGPGGVVVDGIDLDEADAVVVQPDGRIVAGGGAADGVWDGTNSDFVLARFNPDGSLDPTFGVGGKVRTRVTGSSDGILGLALQADGKIVAAGIAIFGASDIRFMVARYDSSGALDPAFGTGGLVVHQIPGQTSSFARAVVIQPADQKIVVGGQSSGGAAGDFTLVRYNTDGTLDGSFGTGGISRLTFAPGDTELCYALALQTDGKLVAAGLAEDPFVPDQNVGVARYSTAGAFDSTFNSTGFASTNINGENSLGTSLAIQPDGRIVVAGRVNDSSGNRDVVILRYLADGTLDPSFDGDGILTDSLIGYEEANAVLIQPDGKIVIAGFAGPTFATRDAMVARYTTAGARDLTFDGDGVLHLPLSTGLDEIRALAWTPAGSIIGAGLAANGTKNEMVVVRIVP